MKILILERDIDVGLTVQEMLGVMGHEVNVVASPGDALTALSKERFDILFTDQVHTNINMGGLLPWMARAVQPNIGVVLMSSWKYEPSDQVPVDAVLSKPFSIDQAEAAIAAACAQR